MREYIVRRKNTRGGKKIRKIQSREIRREGEKEREEQRDYETGRGRKR